MQAMGRGEKSIQQMTEFDTSFRLIEMNLHFLRYQKSFWENHIPKLIKLYEVGWTNLSDTEETEIIEAFKQLKDVQTITGKLTDDLFVVNKKFGKKYGFEYRLRNH